MRNELVVRNRRRRSGRWLEFIVLLGFGLFLILGLGALYLLWSLERQPPLSLADTPEETLQVEQIVPQLAVRHLEGDPLEGLARQASEANQVATAYALLLFDPPDQPIQSSALWVQLSQRQSQLQDKVRGARSAAMAQRIALLDPRLSPLEKAQLLTEIAKAYHSSGYDPLATFTIQQVTRIASQTPGWLPAQRSQLFVSLQPLFTSLAETADSRALKLQVDDFAVNPFLSPNGIVITPTLFSFAHALPLPEPLLSAVTARQQAAKALADRYLLTNGIDVDPEREALHTALLNEDKARFEYVQQAANNAMAIEDRFGVLLAQRDWLTTRLRIALRGYGLPLVNEWEIDRSGMLRELNTNTTSLDALFAELAAGRPTPDLMLTSAYHSSAAWNDTHFKRKEFDDLLAAARAEQNEAKRKQMYQDMQLIIYEQGGTILPVFNNYIFAASKKVDGFSMSPIFAGMRVAEQLYFT